MIKAKLVVGLAVGLGCILALNVFALRRISRRTTFTRTTPSRHFCASNCRTGVPCQYPDEVDFRIIVLTFNRPDSLAKCLSHIASLDTVGDEVVVDIWIDRSKDGKVDERTLRVSERFQKTWTNGRVCVHVQERHAYIIGQWVDTWRPGENCHEMALILEDDVDISPLAYRWLKMVDSRFRNVSGVAGYALQMENVNYVKRRIRPVSNTRSTDNVFVYRLMATWGFSPKPNEWRRFQDWFHGARQNDTFKPFMPGLAINGWFTKFVRQGKADSMWEMWPVYYYNMTNLYTVYSNLRKYTGRKDTLLATNRREAGLHFGKGDRVERSRLLLSKWRSDFENFPASLPRYEFDGSFKNEAIILRQHD